LAVFYIAQKDIDYKRCDHCITKSLNSEIYGYTWFLDAIAGTWDAIIEDDYITVMPLVYSRRFFYKRIYYHSLIKQLGIFSTQPIKADKIQVFLNKIPKDFRKVNICFNQQNTQAIREPHPHRKIGYDIDLITPYEKFARYYPEKVTKALEMGRKMRLAVMKNITIFELDLLLHESPVKISEDGIITPLLRILTKLIGLSKAEIIGIYGPENKLYAIACFISSLRNVTLLFANTLPVGVLNHANYLIVDNFLKTYSGRNVTLRMEHIDNNWNDDLYTSFGAIRSYRYCFHRNLLPWPVKFI